MLGASLSRKAFLAGTVLAALVAIGLSQAVGHVGHQASTAGTGSERDVGELATPCIDDDRVSLSFAASQQDVGLKVADSAKANSTSLTDVCWAVDVSGVVLVYASEYASPKVRTDPLTRRPLGRRWLTSTPMRDTNSRPSMGNLRFRSRPAGPSTPLGQ